MIKHKRKLIFLLMVLLLFSSFPLDGVLADAVEDKIESKGYQEEEIMEIHQDLEKIMKRNDGFFWNDLSRRVGKILVNGIGWVLEFFERGVDSIISMGNFYEMWGVKNMIDNLMPFILGLFLLTLIIVGILLMLNKIDKREELIVNILLAISMLVILPNLFPLLDDALKDGVDHLTYNDSLKDTVVQTNVADLQMYVDADFKYQGNGGSLPNPDKESNWSGANEVDGMKFTVNETFDMYEGERSYWFNKKKLTDFKKDNPNAYNLLITRTDYDGKGDETSLRLLRKNIFPGTEFGRETYYRYAVNWGTILITLSILTIASAITVVKMARIVFDIAFHSIFGLFVAVTDVTGGQRIKKMITEIVSSFAVFFVMVLILRLFIMYANWLVGMKGTIGNLSYILMLLGGAWALLDAPDIVQRLLGIDAGLRSAWGTMAGAYGLAKGAQGIGKMAGKGAGGAIKGASGAGAFARGALGMQPKGGGGSNMQKSPVESGDGGNPPNPPSSGGGDDGDPPNPPSSGGGDDGNPPNPPSGGGSDGGNPSNPPSGGGSDGGNPSNPPSGGGGVGNSFDDPQKTMRFNLDAPNEPISSSGSGNISGSNPPSGGASGGGNPRSGGDGGGGNPPIGGSGGGSSSNDGSDDGSDFGESYGSGMQPEFVSATADERNPYYKPTIFGGGRRGQEVAVNQAKAYNSGLNMRNNISKAMNTGRQFKNFTIASMKYSLGMNPSKKNINEE